MARDPSRSNGVSLAKGPVAILGLIGIVYGVSGLIFASHGFALHIPHGSVQGKHWIGLLVNGWSELLFIAAGLALALFAPAHWGAKSMSMLVGLVLLVAAVVAAIRGNGVFGIFAANKLTELVWAAAGVLLLVLSLLPRVGGHGRDERSPRARQRGPAAQPPARARDAPARGADEQTAPQRERAAAGARRVDTTHKSEE